MNIYKVLCKSYSELYREVLPTSPLQLLAFKEMSLKVAEFLFLRNRPKEMLINQLVNGSDYPVGYIL